MYGMEKKHLKLLLILLIVVLVAVDYPVLDKLFNRVLVDYEFGIIDRVIDGDTVVINGTSVRLLGINSPERGEQYYEESKNLLGNLTLNKLVKLQRGGEDTDKYNRLLRHVFINNENVNVKMVENGLANFYFPSGKNLYYSEFKKAWEKCIKEDENLCEKSKGGCAKCIVLKKFDYENEIIELYNMCEFDCELTDWEIKDEGRKKFIFPEFILKPSEEVDIIVGEGKSKGKNLFWTGENYVWTFSGDTLFLRDDDGKLILYKSY